MSQNSLVLPTTGTLSGLALVQDVNNALDTLNTLAAGSSAPSSPEAGQFWHDTANAQLKLRSVDNSAWIVLQSLDEVNYLAQPRVMPTLFGLTLSNDATTPNTVMDIAAGGAFDSTATWFMRLPAAITKNMAAAWAQGTGNGGLDTGSLQANSGYHMHLIYNPSTRVVDVVASLSFTNPTLQSGWNAHIPIGCFRTDGNSHIVPATWTGNRCIYAAPTSDAYGANPSQQPSLLSLGVPQGVKVMALFRANLQSNYTGGTPILLFQSPDEVAASATLQNGSLTIPEPSSNVQIAAGEFKVLTNTAGQIRVGASISNTYITYNVSTYGIDYPRGLQ